MPITKSVVNVVNIFDAYRGTVGMKQIQPDFSFGRQGLIPWVNLGCGGTMPI